jgi:hypothetical protein
LGVCRCFRLANVPCFDESAFILSESLRDFGVVADAGVLSAPGKWYKKQGHTLCRHTDALTPHPAPGDWSLSLSNEKSFALAEKSPDEKTFALVAANMLVTGSYWHKFTVGHFSI